MKKYVMVMAVATMVLVGCGKISKEEKKSETMEKNPLMEESTLPYFAPDFTKIKNKHFLPAMKAAMKSQNVNIQAIVEQKATPSFENVIVALEKSGADLNRVSNVFYALAGSNTNDSIKAMQKELSPLMSAHRDGIYLNDATGFFKRSKRCMTIKVALS